MFDEPALAPLEGEVDFSEVLPIDVQWSLWEPLGG